MKITASDIINMNIKKTAIRFCAEDWDAEETVYPKSCCWDAEGVCTLYRGFTDDIVSGGWFISTNGDYLFENVYENGSWDDDEERIAELEKIRSIVDSETYWEDIEEDEAECLADAINALNRW